MAAVAFEGKHRVYQVLEHARSGDAAVLGHVTDEEGRRSRPLRPFDEPRGDVAHLGHASRRGVETRDVQRLHGIDGEDQRP